MVRWAPGVEDRLRAAALELFAELGFEQTTVAQLAARAGVTERTFYRYFTDKREVLFAGSERLQQEMVAAVRSAPSGSLVSELVPTALDALGQLFTAERRPYARRRQAVLQAQPALQERELLKLASLKAALAEAIAERDVDPERAALAAEVAVGVFSVSFGRWLAAEEDSDLVALQRAALAELPGLVHR